MGLSIRRAPSRKAQLITTLVAVFALVAQPLYSFMTVRVARALDGTLSAPSLISPGDGVPVRGGNLMNDWSDVSGAAHYVYQSFNLNPDGTCNYNDQRGSDGIYTSSQTDNLNIPDDSLRFCWRVKAVDLLDESNWSDTWKTVVDNKAPDVSIAPIGTVGGNTLTISGSATDNIELAGYTYRIFDNNHVMLGENVMNNGAVSGGVLGTWDISGLTSGTYYVQLAATDRAGNSLPVPYEASFTIDHTAPVVTVQLTSPAHPMASTDPIALAGHVDGEFTSLTLMQNDDAPTAINLTPDAEGNWTYTIPKESVVRGMYNFSVIATDVHGNESVPATVSVEASAYVPGEGKVLSTGLVSSPVPSFIVPNVFAAGTTQPFTEVQPQTKPDSTVQSAEAVENPAMQQSDTPVVAATASGWKFFGIAWYWLVLILMLVMGGIWWTATNVTRHRESQFALKDSA